MFSLIITVISILLVAALALATLYYGGAFAQDGQAKAQTAKYLQEGNQLVGALELYKSDHNGVAPSGTGDEVKQLLLDEKYLSSWPNTNWQYTTDYAIRADVSRETCEAINAKLKIATVPQCSDTTYTNVSICCTSDE